MKAVVPALLVAALFLGACSSEKKTETKPAPTKTTTPAKTGNMGVMNSKCPISGKATDPEVTSDYKGSKVAFCCEGCQGKFAKLSDADKAAKVAAAR
jgi:PBP1b-binding outer membrane lipoprotein LpoB